MTGALSAQCMLRHWRQHLVRTQDTTGRATLPTAVTSRNGASGETDWEHYFGAVRRRKWTVIGVTLLGTAVGLLASRLLHAPYSATALLWFETKDRAAGSRDPRASEGDELLNP